MLEPPTMLDEHVLVIWMHGPSVTSHSSYTTLFRSLPHGLTPEAVATFVFPPQTARMLLLYRNPAPGANVRPLVIVPATVSLTETLVRVTLPQFVTVPL